jgi:hypothetical protein
MTGGQATEQGDCSKFKSSIPHCCKRDPETVDLLPGTPYSMQVANCCKGGVLGAWARDPENAVASFQVSVGQAGKSDRTVRVPKHFTLKAPGPGYTCGPAKLVRPTKFASPDGRRTTQAHSKIRSSFFLHVLIIPEYKCQADHHLFSSCSDVECDLYILTVCQSKVTNLLCFTLVVLQQHHC